MVSHPELASLHAVVSGIVQGVFYRGFVLREATTLGLRGRVRNLDDGRVEVEAEGERQGLDRLVQRLRRGPPSADVSDVTTEWTDCRHEYKDFRIDYS
jgi:acylphosphatase